MKRISACMSVALAVLLLSVSPAAADPVAEPLGQFFGHATYDLSTGVTTWDSGGFQTRLPGDVYNNTNPAAPANFGFSSTDLASIFGDRVNTTGVGLLNEQDFTFFNSSSGGNTNAYQTATFNISLLDGPTSTPLGGYTTGTVNFGAGGLPVGFFTIITITGIVPANINLVTQDVQVRQQLATFSLVPGGAGLPRSGIASLDPPTIGSSANTMFISNSTTPAGYYNIGNPPLNANPGYRLNVVPEPGTMILLGMGLAVLARRRQRN